MFPERGGYEKEKQKREADGEGWLKKKMVREKKGKGQDFAERADAQQSQSRGEERPGAREEFPRL